MKKHLSTIGLNLIKVWGAAWMGFLIGAIPLYIIRGNLVPRNIENILLGIIGGVGAMITLFFFQTNYYQPPSGREVAFSQENDGRRARAERILSPFGIIAPSLRSLLPPLSREPPKLISFVSGNPAAVPLLAAARSRSGSDITLWCHSRPSRRFATSRRKAWFQSRSSGFA